MFLYFKNLIIYTQFRITYIHQPHTYVYTFGISGYVHCHCNISLEIKDNENYIEVKSKYSVSRSETISRMFVNYFED